MRIWIDADATPRDVKEIVFRAAKRLGIETVLVANRRLLPPPGNLFVSAVQVDGGPDIADRHIVAHAIGERLSLRDLMDNLRLTGAVTAGPPPYDTRAKQAFASALDRALTRLRSRRQL